MTHDELKAKVDRLHALMSDPSEGSIMYQIAVGDAVQDLCDAWGRPDPAKVARAALDYALSDVDSERLEEPQDCEEDRAYDCAVRHCSDAIRAVRDSHPAIAAIIKEATK